jgi:dihydrofolate reductase
MKCSVYIAVSLDGFIARRDGSLDWLPQPDATAPGEDYGYAAFMASVDMLVMGRATYDFVRTVDPWPYAKPVVVLSRRPLDIPAHLTDRITGMSGSPREIVDGLAARGAQHLYIDGGRTIQQFLAAGRIDDLIITRIPVLIGDGLPLFGPVPHDVAWRHVETHAYASGLVQSRYTRASVMA